MPAPKRKLTDTERIAIFKLTKTGKSDGAIAVIYGCTPNTVKNIRTGHSKLPERKLTPIGKSEITYK